MGFDCVITKRENATEKNDFMVISNYFQYPGTVFINLLYTHTYTHTHATYDGYTMSKKRQNLSEMMC